MYCNVRKSLASTSRWAGIFRASSQLRRAKTCHILGVSSVADRNQCNKRHLGVVERLIFSQGSSLGKMDLNYQDIVDLLDSDSEPIIFIDVREPTELEEDGRIPNTINIPLGELRAALQMPELQFLNKYGVQRPEHDSSLVFHCRSGNRSRKAMAIARELEYKSVRHYAGGFMDWVEKTAKK